MVSIVIPTYNGARFITDAVNSCFRQSHLPDELIVVDDCSSDDTVALAEAALRSSPVPWRLEKRQKNSGGPAVPTNEGVRLASGDLIHVLDQDDVLLPETLKHNVTALSANPTANVAMNWCTLMGGNGEIRQRESLRNIVLNEGVSTEHGSLVKGSRMIQLLVRYGTIPAGFPGFTFRKRAFENAGGANESLRIACDLDLLLKLMQSGDCLVAPVVGFELREHDNNATRDRKRMVEESCRVLHGLLKPGSPIARDEELAYHIRRKCRRTGLRLMANGSVVDGFKVARLAMDGYARFGRVTEWTGRLVYDAVGLGWSAICGSSSARNSS